MMKQEEKVLQPADRERSPGMTNPPNSGQRPLAFDDGEFYWNMRRVPRTLPDGKTPHPGRSSAIFVVHGMGRQDWTETAAHLRAGFEDAIEKIAAWQKAHLQESGGAGQITLPPPFVFDGYWADYDDIRTTFPEDWKLFNDFEEKFYSNLWKQRIVSGSRTFRWILRQQFRLLHPRVLREVGLLAWILYWPLQIVSSVALLFAWFRYREPLTGFVNDVRLYLEPQGVVERAIVQRIDERVEVRFLGMIGLDREFRPLPFSRLLQVGGERVSFSRVVWVAHSLGTVISYNVLSALFSKAAEIEQRGDAEQKEGVSVFRHTLCRFVTMGSPLDKVAFLFKRKSLIPWPNPQRRSLLIDGETLADKDPAETEWWINFYHVLDPASGALDSPFICGAEPPSNIHIRSGFIPGFAHIAYWKDPSALRFILGRTFGPEYLRDKEYRPWSPTLLSALAGMAYFTWAAVLFSAVYGICRWGPDLLRESLRWGFRWITG
jgi:hypothetical protein